MANPKHIFPDLTKFTDPVQLRKLGANARRLGYAEYAFAVQLRIAELAGIDFTDELEREFWTAVAFAEEVKTLENGKTTRLTRTRLKHAKVGARQCLVDWALDPKVTDGFEILVGNGRADLTGEAIVLRHRDLFTEDVIMAAERKLREHGVELAAA